MPNILVQLRAEQARVRGILEKLDAKKQDEALRSLRFADLAIQQCSIENMHDSLDELQEFTNE
jgi:hypothetical protein